jgi:hypothetical protein
LHGVEHAAIDGDLRSVRRPAADVVTERVGREPGNRPPPRIDDEDIRLTVVDDPIERDGRTVRRPPGASSLAAPEVSRRSPVPPLEIRKRLPAPFPNRVKTTCLPFGDQST